MSAVTAAVARSLVSHLVVAVTALAAGIVAGGWLAFETGHWRAFKSWIEGLAGVATLLVVGLLGVALAVSVLAAYSRASTE